jgi:hypothetical protein
MNEKKLYTHLIQDNTTAHIVNNSMAAADEAFVKQLTR